MAEVGDKTTMLELLPQLIPPLLQVGCMFTWIMVLTHLLSYLGL